MKGIIKWFIGNPIAANLLMIAMLLGGYLSAGTIKKETWPTYIGNRVDISMIYPGAASSEVEQQIVVRIEEAIADLPGIFQITSESKQGYGRVSVNVIEGHDVRTLLSDIKTRVDAIDTFPTSAERLTIKQNIWRPTLMWVALYGDAERGVLKNIAFQIRDEMAMLEGVSEVQITGLKEDELSIEVTEANLRRYNLTFDEVAAAIRKASVNLPAGVVRTKDGDMQIQARAQAFSEPDFENIVIRSQRDGSQLRLADVANITDGFSERYVEYIANGKPALNLEVKISDDPLLFEGTANARAYIEDLQKELPNGVELKINLEYREMFDSRFELLTNNALSGLLLVFIILILFLRPQLAFWVVSGIATTFAGAIWLLPYFDVSINMLSMFAFLMVLGIVVDDAIIVGESIYRHQQKGEAGGEASYSGTLTVLMPVILAVFSTIMFFVPLMGVPSTELIYSRSIFFVVLLCLIFSLIESLLILPSHLSHMKPETPSRFYPLQQLEMIRQWFSQKMHNIAHGFYLRTLSIILSHRASSYLVFAFMFAIATTVVTAGWLSTSFFPNVPQPFVMVNIGFPEGTPFARTKTTAQHILTQATALSTDPELLEKNGGRPFIDELSRSVEGTSATIFVGLTPDEERSLSSEEVAEALRQAVGPLPEAQSYSLNSSMNGEAPDIALNLTMLHNQREIQQSAVDDVLQALSSYSGVVNARSDLDSERTEVEIELKAHAQTLGVTLADVAGQVRQGFYGEEIQRIPRAKEDVKVMLRYAAQERETLDTLDTMRILTADGRELPISAVADIKLVPGPSTIRRVDRMRNIAITADVQNGTDANAVVTAMLEKYSGDWERKYSGFNLTTDGNLKQQAQFGNNFAMNFAKVFALVFALFAIVFRSFFQPLLVMLAVPFGFVGAVIGHLIFDVDLSMFSGFGFLACAGVVVNDNLVLLERINQLKARGRSIKDAVLYAGVDRFRPIVLTSATTFIGLLPILFERSGQAQFLIPMVISLAFGVLFSSVVTLLLVPCGYYGGHEMRIRLSCWAKKISPFSAPG